MQRNVTMHSSWASIRSLHSGLACKSKVLKCFISCSSSPQHLIFPPLIRWGVAKRAFVTVIQQYIMLHFILVLPCECICFWGYLLIF